MSLLLSIARNRLGGAESTAATNIAAEKIHLTLRTRRGLPHDTAEAEIQGENLQLYFTVMMQILATTPIPCNHAFDSDLNPISSNSHRCCQSKNLLLYAGQWFKNVRISFPDHDNYKDLGTDEYPLWYTQLRSDFTEEHKQFITSVADVDLVFGTEKIHAIYRDNKGTKNERGTSSDWFSLVDLSNIFEQFLHHANGSNNFIQYWAWLLITFLAMGRPGEVRFLNYNDWEWHRCLGILNIWWTEMKRLRKYDMPMIPDSKSFLFDFYCCMGCFYCIESGLMMDEEQLKNGQENVVFTKLFLMKTNNVASALATAMRKIIKVVLGGKCPASIIKSIQKKFTGKSLRSGSITRAAYRGILSILELCARSGHSTGTSADHYINSTNPLNGLRALKELLEYDNLESNVIVPTLLCLGPRNQGMVRNFVHALLPSNIRLFEEGNSLYPVRENCCAAMLQYYLQVQRELGYSNVVTSKMREIANLINLSDSNFPNLSPALVVAEWSKIIAKDVSDRKLGSITAASADLHSMSSTLNQLTTMVGGL